MSADFNLDVAFSSDVTPDDPTLPIAMAFGYTRKEHGVYVQRGQSHETAKGGSSVAFAIYDTAQNPSYNVVSVQISTANKAPGAGQPNTPFSDPAWANGSITAVSNPGSGQVQLNGPNPSATSTGVNLKSVSGSTCRSWTVGPFTVAPVRAQQKFGIIITVLMQDAQQNQKSFKVDPEVVVDTGNK